MIKAALIALCIALFPAMANAQSIRSVLQEFGLLGGTWAPDCTKGPSTSNWHGRFVALSSGDVRHIYSSKKTSDGDNAYVIRLARRLSDKEILLGQELVRLKRNLEVVLYVDGDRYHTKSAKRADGTFSVKDGKYVEGGDSPWLRRCR